MQCPELNQISSEVGTKMGWPWTEESPQLPAYMPDGSEWPKISIVTPSYNQGQFLEETIRSVLLQGYPNLEYIIIDGGSTDDSVKIIKKYEAWLTYWASGPDRGQSHAINKGLTIAKGVIFNWINSDDLLMPTALAKVAQTIQDADALATSVVNFSDLGYRKIFTSQGLSAKSLILGEEKAVFQQPGLWLLRECIAKCGGIDETYHYAFDIDLAIRYLGLFPNVAYTPEVTASFRLHPFSKTVSQSSNFYIEHKAILRKLLTLAEFQPLHSFCEKRLNQLAWWEMLNELQSTHRSTYWRAIQIVLAACQAPNERLNRMTVGSIRRLLTG